MLNGTNKAGIFPPLHRAESSCKVTTIHSTVARLAGLFSAAAMFLSHLISQLEEYVLKTDALSTVVQYRYLHVDQSRQQLVPHTLFRLSILDLHLFEFDVQPAECFVRSFLGDSQNTHYAPKRFLSLRDELCRNAYLHVVVPGLLHDLALFSSPTSLRRLAARFLASDFLWP